MSDTPKFDHLSNKFKPGDLVVICSTLIDDKCNNKIQTPSYLLVTQTEGKKCYCLFEDRIGGYKQAVINEQILIPMKTN